MGTAGATLGNKSSVKKVDKSGVYVTGLIMSNYQIGDFVIVDTKDGSKHVGFYGGIILHPKPLMMLASVYREFDMIWDKKYLDIFHTISVPDVLNMKAAPVIQQ